MKLLHVFAVLLIGGAVAAQAAEPITLRIADQKGNMRAQLEAAHALDNLPGYQIQWAEFPAAAPLAEALNAGAADAGIIGDGPLLFTSAAGAPVKAIAVDQADPYGTAVLVPQGSPLQTAADLKGKRIATGRGSIGHYVAVKALASAGLTAKDVEFKFLGPVDAKIALANGSVDAWATWEPYTAQAELVDKARVLVSGRGLLAGNSFLAATDQALADPARHAALQDYVNRITLAQRWAYRNLDSYSKSLAAIIGFPPEVARLQFERRAQHWEAISDNVVQQQQEVADFYHQTGMIPVELKAANTFDHSFSVPPASETAAR
ncbi:ABC transporter substrate-binding protein [Pseudomonas typographi]|uniref:ABC transporter substrate-binding protein n=1 Tax=Pseudomonas typographi TaxID=2715964 RepID=UPI0016891103|nr:ABC transporter substrate-binding protein [Pseudomonas typographi]MBD1589885.1 ABC transporter substrate-binding protein [Pseudomonas typographi]